MNNKMNIEFNGYGICVDSEWFYLALDWKLIAISTALFIGYRVYKTFYKK